MEITLFYRNYRTVTMTPDGHRFLERAEQILQMHDDLVQEIHDRSKGMATELIIGAPAITGEHVLPPLINAFRTRVEPSKTL